MIIFQMLLVPLVALFMLGAVFVIGMLSMDLSGPSAPTNISGSGMDESDPSNPTGSTLPTSSFPTT